MKALFITTVTMDCGNHFRAFESAYGPTERMIFNANGIVNDWMFVERAEKMRPDAIFYIGPCEAPGVPRPDALRTLRKIAPLINIISDAADAPWHAAIARYRAQECFDLYVSIDGAKRAPIDLATLTPVDPEPFKGVVGRDIKCGFSGGLAFNTLRHDIVHSLQVFGLMTVRRREKIDDYADHVAFLKRCRMVLNTSMTGSGQAHHIKGRVIEAGWAGCCLLEQEGSPIADWFPADCYVTYRDPRDAAAIVERLDDDTISLKARRLAEEVRARFTPGQIYGEMLRRVDRPKSLSAA